MFLKKLFILSALALAPSMVFAMEGPSDPKRARASNSFEQEEEDNLAVWAMELNAYMFNLDVAGVRAQLAQLEASYLISQEKEPLLDKASNRELLLSTMARAGLKLTEDATNAQIIQKFSFEADLEQATQIKNLLKAFQLLKGFRFPQALFTQQPYNGNPAQSLDMVLEALIENEQEQVQVCCYHLTLHNIAEALVNQMNKGVAIEVVTNQKQGDIRPDKPTKAVLHTLKHLVKNGIAVVAPKNNGYEDNHHKFFIFTSNVTNKALIWNGSYNPTGHANKNSWDDVTIIDDAGVVQSFCDRFDQIKAASSPITAMELDNTWNEPARWSLENNNVPRDLWYQ